jgi:transcriptional regulator with XRE-family HTH domain
MKKSIPLHEISKMISDMKELNRLKVVLVEKKRTGKWLAKQLDKDPATISRWCSNSIQPSVETFAKIAELLNVDMRILFNKHK